MRLQLYRQTNLMHNLRWKGINKTLLLRVCFVCRFTILENGKYWSSYLRVLFSMFIMYILRGSLLSWIIKLEQEFLTRRRHTNTSTSHTTTQSLQNVLHINLNRNCWDGEREWWINKSLKIVNYIVVLRLIDCTFSFCWRHLSVCSSDWH